MKRIYGSVAILALPILAGCWPSAPLPVVNEVLPTGCNGTTFIEDNTFDSPSQITGEVNAIVTFSNNIAQAQLTDPFQDGSVTTQSAVYPIPRITSVASVENIGAPSAINPAHGQPPYPAMPPAGMHVTMNFEVQCAADAPSGAVVKFKGTPTACGVLTDTFSPASVTCTPGAAFKVTAQRNWDGDACHDVGTMQAMLAPIPLALISSKGSCMVGLPVR